MIWKLSMCLERILLHDLRYGMHKLLDTSYGKTVTKEIVSLNMDKVLLSTNCVSQVTYQISFTKSQCCKQELTSSVISLIPNFLAGFVKKKCI